MAASKSALQELPFAVKPVAAADFLADVDFTAAPYLLGHVLTKVKPTAELWLVSEQGNPILATWRYGLGQAAAFTSDAKNHWAVEWLKWEGFGKFWVQLTRKLSRSVALKYFPVSVRQEPGAFTVSVDLSDEHGNFLDNLDGEFIALDTQDVATRLPVKIDRLGQARIYWLTDKKGVYHGQLVLKQEGRVVANQYITVTQGYSTEFSLQKPDELFMQKLAAIGGGKWNLTPEEILANDERRAMFDRELWPWLVLAALGLFVLDVAAHRQILQPDLQCTVILGMTAVIVTTPAQ
jgi:hypothetical protein